MAPSRAALRPATIATRIPQNLPTAPRPNLSLNAPRARRSIPVTSPHPSQWFHTASRELHRQAPSSSGDPALVLPRPPFIDIRDPAVFVHPSALGDMKSYAFERPANARGRSGQPAESFEKLEYLGKHLLKLTVTELITNEYGSLTVPAVDTLLTRVLSRESLSRLSDHYSLSARLLSDPLALDYLKLSPAVQTSLFYAYTAGIYRQEGVIYATQWIRQCFRLIVDQEYRKLRDGFAPKIPIREDPELPPVRVDWQRKPGNPNYVLPSSLPLDQLDTHVKRHRLEPPIWLYSVKGVAPDEVFRAELTVGDRTVEGSGRSKNRAKQIAAAAFLGIRDVDPETIKASRRSSELPQTNYTARLFDYVKQVDMATPTFDTMPWPKQPNWKAVLRIGDETFEATGRGQTAARRAAAKKALAFVNPSHAFETILLNHILSRNYTIAFLFEKISSSPPEPNTTSDLNWICKVAVQDAAAKEEIGEVFAKGFTKAIARAAAVERAAEMLGIEKASLAQTGNI